jgi:ABC-type antimicrobial peptide transport system permease subunit
MVLRDAGGLTLLGVIPGLALSLFLARLVKSMLYGLQPFDPVSLIAAAALLITVSLVAGWVAAMRAL